MQTQANPNQTRPIGRGQNNASVPTSAQAAAHPRGQDYIQDANGQQQMADNNNQAAAGASVFALDTRHDDNINDCQFDYYGTSIASCDSNGFLSISALKNGVHETETAFQAHSGPIWQLAWAHPKYDSVIATGGFDGCVKVWQRDANGVWDKDHASEIHRHASSVNCLAWAPWEYGLILAVGTAEGRLAVYQRQKDGSWSVLKSFVAHEEGVNGISWGPPTQPAILSQTESSQAAAGMSAVKFQLPPKRLVSGGNDNHVRVWQISEGEQSPEKQDVGVHDDWVRDVAWCQNIGLMHEMIASCSEDQTCRIWISQEDKNEVKWMLKQKLSFSDPAADQQIPLWKVSWSQVGNMLAVSGGDNQVRILSEEANGEWKQIQVINEETSQESSGHGVQAM